MTGTPSEKQKMLAGLPYHASCPELVADQQANHAWLLRYNAALACTLQIRRELLIERLARVGHASIVRPPFYCDYGYNIEIGARVFINFNCTILDVGKISIGDATQIGPSVQIYSADHPRDPAERLAGLESSRPVKIGCNVWIGGGAIILPGVTIGDNAIIGAGSVVTRDVAPGVTVAGNPARPMTNGAGAL